MFLHMLREPEVLSAPQRLKIATSAQKFLNRQLLYYAKTREVSKAVGDDSQRAGFLVGDAGVFAVGAVLAKAIGKDFVLCTFDPS